MLEEISKQGFLIPAVTAALVAWLWARFSEHNGWTRQNRKDCLEVLKDGLPQDNLRLELFGLQLVGRTIPAAVIRRVVAIKEPLESLRSLAILWPLLRYDAETEKVHWRHPGQPAWIRALGWSAAYAVCAMLALFYWQSGIQQAGLSFDQIVASLAAVILSAAAGICLHIALLWWDHRKSGDALLERVNIGAA